MDNQNVMDLLGAVTFGTPKAWRRVLGTEAFWIYVDKTDDCWLWQGTCLPSGHGQYYDGSRSQPAHRYAFSLTYGYIPKGQVVRHRCSVAACVNPEHLILGTHRDNMLDRKARKLAGSKPGELLIHEDMLGVAREYSTKGNSRLRLLIAAKEVREKSTITLKAISKVTGVSPFVLSTLMSFYPVSVPLDDLAALVAYFDCSVADVLQADDVPEAKQAA